MTNLFFAMDQVDVSTVLGEHLINAILENASVETVKDILKSGAPVWYQNEEEGMSPLHAAAYVQNEELVTMLIEKGAVWNAGTSFPPFRSIRTDHTTYRQSTTSKTPQAISPCHLTTQKYTRASATRAFAQVHNPTQFPSVFRSLTRARQKCFLGL